MSGIFSPHGDSFMLTAAAVIYGRSLGNLISRPVCSIHTQTQAEDHMLNSSISTLLFTLRGQINDTELQLSTCIITFLLGRQLTDWSYNIINITEQRSNKLWVAVAGKHLQLYIDTFIVKSLCQNESSGNAVIWSSVEYFTW